MFQCYKCGAPIIAAGKPGFQDVCESCGSYVHCCMNCRFYEADADKCVEPVAEWLSDRLTFNRCEYFQSRAPRTPPPAAGLESGGGREEGRRFRKPDWRNVHKHEKRDSTMATPTRGDDDRAREARRNLDNLFRKPDGSP
jgi:hypothetical protein